MDKKWLMMGFNSMGILNSKWSWLYILYNIFSRNNILQIAWKIFDKQIFCSKCATNCHSLLIWHLFHTSNILTIIWLHAIRFRFSSRKSCKTRLAYKYIAEFFTLLIRTWFHSNTLIPYESSTDILLYTTYIQTI